MRKLKSPAQQVRKGEPGAGGAGAGGQKEEGRLGGAVEMEQTLKKPL